MSDFAQRQDYEKFAERSGANLGGEVCKTSEPHNPC